MFLIIEGWHSVQSTNCFIPEGIHSHWSDETADEALVICTCVWMMHKYSMCFYLSLACLTSRNLSTDLTFTWIFNEYPSFVIQDTRRFVSQKTGDLYIAKVEPSDVGNYTCVVTNTVTKTSVQGPPTPLVLRVDGMKVLFDFTFYLTHG